MMKDELMAAGILVASGAFAVWALYFVYLLSR